MQFAQNVSCNGICTIKLNSKSQKKPEEYVPSRPLTFSHKKVYILIFALVFLLAASLYVWPSFAYGGMHSCPANIANLSFEISNYSQIVGPPLFSQEQFLLNPGSTTYVTYIYNSISLGNNLTSWFGQYNAINKPDYLWKVDGFTGLVDSTPINQTGLSYSFQNISFDGIHVAKLIYRISVSRSAQPASYELAITCGTPGLLMTVGSLAYWGPLPFGETQLMSLFVNTLVAIIIASILSAGLHLYWSKKA